MTRRPAMPVPGAIAAEMTRIIRTAGELADLAQHVGDAYADLYDAAFRKTSGGDGLGINRPGAPLGDPTGDVATSGMHRRIRCGDHQYLDSHPYEKEAFWRSEIGDERFDALAARAHGKRDR